jgi:hypothetical protein
MRAFDVRYANNNSAKARPRWSPNWVDAVENVENRTTPKISQMVIFGAMLCSAGAKKSVVVF